MPNAIRRCRLAAILLPVVALCAWGQSSLVITDGSVCLSDEARDFPSTATHRHERAFTLGAVWLETSTAKKTCEAAAVCSGAGCRPFGAGVKDIVVDYREGSEIRHVLFVFEGSGLRMTSGGLTFDQWQPQKPGARRQVQRGNGKIERVYIDGQGFDCRAAQCRVTIRAR